MRFEVKNGSFGYGNTKILQNISFSLEGNSLMAVLGSNGVGKTTLLKCMMGLLKWNEGETRLDGRPLSSLRPSDVWKRIAYVPQAKGAALSYTALEMVLMGRSARLGLFAQPTEEDLAAARVAGGLARKFFIMAAISSAPVLPGRTTEMPSSREKPLAI